MIIIIYTCDFLPEIKGFCCARPLARMIRFMHADTTLGFSAIVLPNRRAGGHDVTSWSILWRVADAVAGRVRNTTVRDLGEVFTQRIIKSTKFFKKIGKLSKKKKKLKSDRSKPGEHASRQYYTLQPSPYSVYRERTGAAHVRILTYIAFIINTVSLVFYKIYFIHYYRER